MRKLTTGSKVVIITSLAAWLSIMTILANIIVD